MPRHLPLRQICASPPPDVIRPPPLQKPAELLPFAFRSGDFVQIWSMVEVLRN
uniref:Uncharacterized protein n=1 Tax=Kalanchoe fedtschenkoi TaxID=63787 RepID=A0A7N1A640_KALFE